MAGFNPIIYGRFWVITEGSGQPDSINPKQPTVQVIPRNLAPLVAKRASDRPLVLLSGLRSHKTQHIMVDFRSNR
jgi:hypothetical protein